MTASQGPTTGNNINILTVTTKGLGNRGPNSEERRVRKYLNPALYVLLLSIVGEISSRILIEAARTCQSARRVIIHNDNARLHSAVITSKNVDGLVVKVPTFNER